MSAWTSVKDALPPADGKYLVYDGDSYCVCSFYLASPAIPGRSIAFPARFGYGSDYFEESCITHWMPLPDPPA